MKLQVQAVQQPKRAEFLFTEPAVQTALHLVAELCHPLIDELGVILVIAVHAQAT